MTREESIVAFSVGEPHQTAIRMVGRALAQHGLSSKNSAQAKPSFFIEAPLC